MQYYNRFKEERLNSRSNNNPQSKAIERPQSTKRTQNLI